MKKKMFILVAVLLCVLFFFGASKTSDIPQIKTVAAENPEKSPLDARFLNMLNHNFVYDEDFTDFDKIVSGAVLSCLSSREGNYIRENYVKGYVSDMYGIEIAAFNEKAEVPHKDGFVYIQPMGFTRFEHKNIEVKENEDGTFTVLTSVTVRAHDGKPFTTSAVSLFAPKKESSFGYILVYSKLSKDEA